MTGVVARARAEVETVIHDVVRTIEDGVTHPDDSPGIEPGEAERLRADLRGYAEAVIQAARSAARGTGQAAAGSEVQATVDAAIETIRRGVLGPAAGPGFGPDQARELGDSLRELADAIVRAAGEDTPGVIDAPVEHVVRTLRSGLFLVYGRAGFAAITADQLTAYLQTFADAVLTVVEKER